METTVITTAERPLPGLSDRFQVTREKVIRVVERIVAKASPLRVIAFGSRARGTHRPDSDLDLAVIVERYEPTRDPLPVGHADLHAGMSVDMLVFERSRHEFMKDSIVSVHNYIENEGVTLYDASVGSVDLGAVARITR